jgi:hypothetical protein
MKGNFAKMMKQVREMQNQMAKIQSELSEEKVEATAGGGMVKAVVSGTQQLLELKINPEVVNSEEVDLLEDMVMAAVNEALRQSQDLASQKLGKLAGGLGNLGLPGIS